jgi:hypothetical protein
MHRILGVVLFLATLSVAIHCMIAYGVQTTSARVTVHSFAGCFLYGAFLAKVLLVRSRQMLGWVSPSPVGCWSLSSESSGTRAPSGSSMGTTYRVETSPRRGAGGEPSRSRLRGAPHEYYESIGHGGVLLEKKIAWPAGKQARRSWHVNETL